MKSQITSLENGNNAMTGPGWKRVLALFRRLLLAAALMLMAFGASAGVVLTTLHSFNSSPMGANPNGLVHGSDGFLYGTTSRGGTNGNVGTVFKISTNGALTSLYSFSGGNDGTGPSGLVQGSDGNFYGTTAGGGQPIGGYAGRGTVFKISPNGSLASLYAFDGTNGQDPASELIQGSDGYFYGTTVSGGTNDTGTVFKISTNGTLTSLYSCNNYNNEYPVAGLVQGSDGYFYGTTPSPENGTFGTVFKISASGVETTIFTFPDSLNDGNDPQAGLIQGSDGNLYGTTRGGGTNGYWGTVFRITTNGVETVLYSFSDGNDGGQPYAGLVQDSGGDLYGTTYQGGTNSAGTVFKISTNGIFTSLYSFTGGSDGANPYAGLVEGSDGNFYGTTYQGGTNNAGTVFKINADGTFTSLYSFPGGNDGSGPNELVQGNDGNFYGTTYGGSGETYYGTVFKISTNGAFTSLHFFTGSGSENPVAALVQASDGNFYGVTAGDFYGTIFKISTTGSFSTLFSFTNAAYADSPLINNNGADPNGLVQGSDGNLYGTTFFGYYGNVFKIRTNGVFKVLHSFEGGSDPGFSPDAGLVQGIDGYFYGTTAGYPLDFGNVYKIRADGVYTNLYTFKGGNDGGNPLARLVQGSDGNFYGTTSCEDSYLTISGNGTVFKINVNGVFTNLYSFTGGDDGANPTAGLTQGTDGNFYGTTSGGGAYSYGTIFKISSQGTFTSVYSFTGGNAGANPHGGLVLGSDGSFYGTSGGGQGNSGTIFRLAIVPPELTIALSNTNVILTWPADAIGFTLESTFNAGTSAIWNPVLPLPMVVNGQNTVTVPLTDTQMFFRLSQ